ncbi:MAG: phage holin family protein [Chitinophagales bacterium]|nr:phage holin family protein [Bacteroidota bacterium]MCB9257197.1 phage holin family protein [Chitinophagales bacterium]
MNFLVKTLISAAAILLLSFLLPGVQVEGQLLYALLIALVLSFLNSLVRPILIFLTLPATIVSLGLFLLVINAVIILIADKFLAGFSVDGFWWALLFSILLSIINSVSNKVILERSPKNVVRNQNGNKVIIIEKD